MYRSGAATLVEWSRPFTLTGTVVAIFHHCQRTADEARLNASGKRLSDLNQSAVFPGLLWFPLPITTGSYNLDLTWQKMATKLKPKYERIFRTNKPVSQPHKKADAPKQ